MTLLLCRCLLKNMLVPSIDVVTRRQATQLLMTISDSQGLWAIYYRRLYSRQTVGKTPVSLSGLANRCSIAQLTTSLAGPLRTTPPLPLAAALIGKERAAHATMYCPGGSLTLGFSNSVCIEEYSIQLSDDWLYGSYGHVTNAEHSVRCRAVR